MTISVIELIKMFANNISKINQFDKMALNAANDPFLISKAKSYPIILINFIEKQSDVRPK